MAIDPSSTVKVHFSNVLWPISTFANEFTSCIRCEFILDNDGKVFGYNDLKDILKAWLFDEFNVCPEDINFQLELSS